jgi:hypothetical protein
MSLSRLSGLRPDGSQFVQGLPHENWPRSTVQYYVLPPSFDNAPWARFLASARSEAALRASFLCHAANSAFVATGGFLSSLSRKRLSLSSGNFPFPSLSSSLGIPPFSGGSDSLNSAPDEEDDPLPPLPGVRRGGLVGPISWPGSWPVASPETSRSRSRLRCRDFLSSLPSFASPGLQVSRASARIDLLMGPCGSTRC